MKVKRAVLQYLQKYLNRTKVWQVECCFNHFIEQRKYAGYLVIIKDFEYPLVKPWFSQNPKELIMTMQRETPNFFTVLSVMPSNDTTCAEFKTKFMHRFLGDSGWFVYGKDIQDYILQVKYGSQPVSSEIVAPKLL